MATFYLLPPRKELARRFSAYLQVWFPGLHPAYDELPDMLAATAEQSPGVFVVFADDLPEARGPVLEPVLCEGFGASASDRVVDLRDGPVGSDGSLDSWLIRGVRRPLRKVS